MTSSSTRRWTIIGLAVSLLGIPVIVTAQRLLVADSHAAGAIVARELAILALTAFLFWLIVTRERLPLSSIGLRFDGIGRSLAWGLSVAVVAFVTVLACLAAYAALGVHYGEGAAISRSLPVTLLTVIRAGVSEEVFYRGYAVERLQSLTGSKWIAAAVALLAFALFHYRQGVPGILLAFVLGAIITSFYLWKHNLLAIIFAHFLVDFIPNVVLPALSDAS